MQYLFLILLVGCSINVKKKCGEANWLAVGEYDGRAGNDRAVVKTYQKECHDVGVDVDTVKYLRGYERGIRMFCTYETGYELGLEGKRVKVKCPKEFEKGFYRGYNSGKQLYQTRNY